MIIPQLLSYQDNPNHDYPYHDYPYNKNPLNQDYPYQQRNKQTRQTNN